MGSGEDLNDGVSATTVTDLPTVDSEIPRLSPVRRSVVPVATKRKQ